MIGESIHQKMLTTVPITTTKILRNKWYATFINKIIANNNQVRNWIKIWNLLTTWEYFVSRKIFTKLRGTNKYTVLYDDGKTKDLDMSKELYHPVTSTSSIVSTISTVTSSIKGENIKRKPQSKIMLLMMMYWVYFVIVRK